MLLALMQRERGDIWHVGRTWGHGLFRPTPNYPPSLKSAYTAAAQTRTIFILHVAYKPIRHMLDLNIGHATQWADYDA